MRGDVQSQIQHRHRRVSATDQPRDQPAGPGRSKRCRCTATALVSAAKCSRSAGQPRWAIQGSESPELSNRSSAPQATEEETSASTEAANPTAQAYGSQASRAPKAVLKHRRTWLGLNPASHLLLAPPWGKGAALAGHISPHLSSPPHQSASPPAHRHSRPVAETHLHSTSTASDTKGRGVSSALRIPSSAWEPGPCPASSPLSLWTQACGGCSCICGAPAMLPWPALPCTGPYSVFPN